MTQSLKVIIQLNKIPAKEGKLIAVILDIRSAERNGLLPNRVTAYVFIYARRYFEHIIGCEVESQILGICI